MSLQEKRQIAKLDVSPTRGLVTDPVSIKVCNCGPGVLVWIRATTLDGFRREWASSAQFRANDSGIVDVSSQAPLQGSYSGVDGMGLFWSMTPTEQKVKDFFVKSKATPLHVTISVTIDSTFQDEVKITRLFARPELVMEKIEEDGCVGTLFRMPEIERRPSVIILSGSDGGAKEHAAALLASHGFCVLALAYFGLEDLPRHLVDIPLEYFARAIQWMNQLPFTDGQGVTLLGYSRGAELALLLGSSVPGIRAVIAGSPSCILFEGLRGYMPARKPAWTYGGEPLPYLRSKRSFGSGIRMFGRWATRRPTSMLESFQLALKDTQAVTKSTIPVENIPGPVLLLSGTDDQLWPSSQFGTAVMERLQANHHPYEHRHVQYTEAGHFGCFPYGIPSLPPMVSLSPGGGFVITFGGTSSANTVASEKSFQEILRFLSDMAPVNHGTI